MCFDVDYDWYAEINESVEVVLSQPSKCGECGRTLQPGETAQHLFQQQYEECQECEDGGCVDGCDYGETFDADFCLNCYHCVLAIVEVERAEGCKPPHLAPAVGELWEAFRNDDEGRYRAKAVEMWPELEAHIREYA